MKLRLLALLALPYIALGQSEGDLIIQKATASGATEVYVTPVPTKILGLNDSGAPSLINLGSGVTLPGGTLTINPAWPDITGKPTTGSGYGITDLQPLNANLTAISGLTTNAYGLSLLEQTTEEGTRAIIKAAPIFDVRNYGAKGDAQRVDDAVTTASSTTITSATASFTSGDVGKTIWAISPGGILRLSRTTIASVTNSTTIEVTDAAAGSASSVVVIFGTDDTAALQAATAAAKSADARGMVYAPAGGYVFSELPFDFSETAVHSAAGLRGDGSNCTVFYPAPDYDFSSTTPNTGMFARYDGESREGKIEGLRIEGHAYSMSGSGYLVISDAGNGMTLRDVRIEHIRGVSAHLSLNGTDFLVDRCHFEGASYLGVSVAGGGTIQNTYTGNHAYYGLYVTSVNGEINIGLHLSVVNCIIDECTYESCYISGSKDVKFTNVRFFGPVGRYACAVDGTSVARFVNCELIDYGLTGNRGGLQVLPGGAAYLSACRLHGVGTLSGLDNEGTVYDGGSNTIGSQTGSGIIHAAQPLDAQLTSLSGLSYTGNAGKFIRVNAGETAFELATVSGSGTVTSVALSAPTGFAVTGSPITTTGTLALSYDAGYQGYTTTEASKLAGVEAGADVTDATNVAAAGAVMVGGALGTPSSGTMTNVSGTAASLTAGNATAAEGLKSATTTVVVSGATAPTSGQVLTATSSTAANWQTPSGGAGSTVYTIMAQHGQTLTWSDGATYYFGAQYGRTSTITSGGQCSIPIARTGTITKIALRTYSVTAGSSESWEFFVRVNDTTDTSLGTVSSSANARDWNATVSIAVTAGDFIEFKTVCPTWATNPVNNSLIATIYIEE